ncbi:MAG TPA: NAD(P)-binding domain-containing protein [Bacteroidales bacterium]|nr:NAD(P)-binding domain-containing protein [Bacteroidales bacterium]
MKTISFIGGGRITRILAQAFNNANVRFDKVVVYDVSEEALKAVKAKFPQVTTTTSVDEAATAELVILSVHPPMVMETIEKIKGSLQPGSVLLSLAPKFTIEKLTALLGGFANIARMNPSASTIVNKGVNPVSFSASFDADKKKAFLELFRPLGYEPEVADNKIEAYAVISAMGHTYFNFQLQKLKELAVSFGMDEQEAAKTISNMLWGTTETLFNSGLPYAEVADLVPVKPMAEVEETIKGYYDQYLTGIYNRIKP